MRAALFACVFLFASTVLAGEASKAKTLYFYPVPQTEGDEGWSYPTPDCTQVPPEKYAKLQKDKKCKTASTAPLKVRCDSGESVELVHVMSKEKQSFEVSWFIFDSKKRCASDRQAYLSGEE
jgi:hypothetical protein